MSDRGRGRGRLVVMLGAVLIFAGCGGTPAVTPSGSAEESAPAASTSASVPGSGAPEPALVPPFDPDAIAKGAAAEVDLIRAMRAELGVAAEVGADGDAALAAIDAAEQAFGEAFLTEILTEFGSPTAASGAVQLAGFSAGTNLFALQVSTLGQGAKTTTAQLALGTEFLDRADKGLDVPGYKKDETYTDTTGGVTESLKISSTLTIKAGGGKLAVDVEQTTSATLKRGETLVGLLNGDGKGHLDISGCPDAAGKITGTVEVTVSELWSAAGKTGTTDRKVTGTFTIQASDSATLTQVSVHNVTSGSGTDGAGGTWTASGTSGFGTGETPTTTSNGATEAQVSQTSGAAALVLFIVSNAASKAEDYWRSGKCVELTSSRESGQVKPEELIGLQIDAVSKVGGGQVQGPIEATFSGKESLDPSQPQAAPATFQFTAGKDEGDEGTIALKQTSRRGIGFKTLQFKVGGGLTITASGTTTFTGFTLTISIPTTKLVQSGDTYTATVPVTVTGMFSIQTCKTKSVNFTSSATVTVRVSPDNPDVALVGVAPVASMAKQKITTTCSEFPADFPSGPAAVTWFGIFVTSAGLPSVSIDQPTRLTAGSASGTVTIARVQAT